VDAFVSEHHVENRLTCHEAARDDQSSVI